MSNNTSKRDVSARIGSIISAASIDLFQSLTGDTLNVIGPAYKGKAFVPQNITNLQNVTLTVGEESKEFEVFNSLENIIGPERKNIHAHLYDSYSYLSDNQSYDAINTWLSGDKTQATFTRILGIGSGIKNEENMYIGAGFNASNRISRGSIDNLTKSRNPQAIEGGVEGNVTFVLNKREDKVWNNIASNYLEELGLESDHSNYFIEKLIICSDGILPSMIDVDPDAYTLNETASTYNSQEKSSTTAELYLDMTGLNSNEDIDLDNKTRNKVVTKSISENITKPQSFGNFNGISNMNYFPEKFLERGHIVYADFKASAPMLDFKHDHKLLTTRNYNTLDNNLIPDYNSFEAKFQTAKTPWVTSQPVNRHELEDNRQNIHEKVVNLFRFYSLDDGEVGNRFRIKINITTKGNKDTNEYSKFEIFLFEYEARNNSFNQLDHITNIDLNPNSEYYICRIFGDENVYYDLATKKIKSKITYPRRNKYLRVEVHPDVKNKKISSELIPSGFRAYPHIKLDPLAFPDYSEIFNQENTTINQMPLFYSTNYITDNVTGRGSSIENNWGVVFLNTRLHETKTRAISRYFLLESYGRSESSSNTNKYILSPHYYYSKYFLNGMKTSSKNIWVEDDTFLNSFFHLEKICFNNDLLIVDVDPKLDLYYSRKGHQQDGRNYINLDSPDMWDNDNTLIDIFQDKLSFDFFTYGGFDGVDIRDNDKRLMNNNGLSREVKGEDPNIQLYKNPIFNAYNTAIDVATDSILGEDILVLPGISNLNLATKCIDICESKKNIIFINDMTNYNEPIIEDFSEIDNNNSYGNYYLDKVAIKTKEKEVLVINGEGDDVSESVPALDYDINENYSNIVIRPNSTDSRYFLPILGTLKATKTLPNITNESGGSIPDPNPINEIERKLDPVILAIDKTSKTETKISGLVSSINNYSFELLNNSLSGNRDSWESDIAYFRSNKINVLYIPEASEGLSLLSDNTSYEVRKSVFCEYENIRKINIIKKEIKYNLFTKTPVGMMSPVLFSQNSSTKKLYSILELHLNNILDSLKDRELLFDYIVNLPSDLDDSFILDLQNYIIRGTIILKLNKDNNNDIINLELDDILSELSLISEQSSTEVVQPTV